MNEYTVLVVMKKKQLIRIHCEISWRTNCSVKGFLHLTSFQKGCYSQETWICKVYDIQDIKSQLKRSVVLSRWSTEGIPYKNPSLSKFSMDCGIWLVILLKLKSLHQETEILGNAKKRRPNGNLWKKIYWNILVLWKIIQYL
jgi:hypothetical protein